MKTRSASLKLSMVPFVAAAVLGIPATVSAQTNGVWSNLVGSGWPTTSNWTGAAVANGAGAVADFSTLNITAARTVTLDASRSVGQLKFGDTTASHDQTLNTGTAGSILTLDPLSGTGLIEVVNRTTTIGAVLAGNEGLTVTSGATATGTAGTLILNAANTFTGGLTIQGAIVQLSNNASANTGGTNNIDITNAASVSRLVVAGGVTNGSAISATATTGVAGFGVLNHTGTGLATLTGPITLTGNPTAGGNFVGGNAAANALVLSGPISAVSNTVSHRDGFIRYGGGGAGYSSLTVTGTAMVGAANGIPTVASVVLGGSGSATLDLNGFDQSLAGLTLGNSTNAFIGTVNLGARTLTMTGNLSTMAGSAAVPHVINATAGGTLNVDSVGQNLIVNDTLAPDDLTINTAALNGSGGFFKVGPGTLALNGTTGNAPITIGLGSLSIGRTGIPGTFSCNGLTFSGGTLLRADVGVGGDVATVGPLAVGGTTNVQLNQVGGLLAPGDYPILNYTGPTPGVAGFSLEPVGHSTSSLVDTGSAIALRVTANKRLVWDGTYSSTWATAGTGNWKTISGVTATEAEYIVVADAGTGTPWLAV